MIIMYYIDIYVRIAASLLLKGHIHFSGIIVSKTSLMLIRISYCQLLPIFA